MKIRPSRHEDLAAMSGLHVAAFAKGWSRAALCDLIASPGVFGFVAVFRDSAEIQGFALGRIAADDGEILTITVTSDSRRQGIGGLLVDEVRRHLADQGAVRIFLEVATGNAAAKKLYKNHGFTEIGRRKNYVFSVSGGREDALVMRLDLVSP